MEQRILKLRGFIERRNDVWLAFCLELNLGAQGSSKDDAYARLNRMIQSYVDDLAGEDAEHIDDLLHRPAPMEHWIRYYVIGFKSWLRRLTNENSSRRSIAFHEKVQTSFGHC